MTKRNNRGVEWGTGKGKRGDLQSNQYRYRSTLPKVSQKRCVLRLHWKEERETPMRTLAEAIPNVRSSQGEKA